MANDAGRLDRLERQVGEVLQRLATLEAPLALPQLGPTRADLPADGANVLGTLAYSGSIRAGSVRVNARFDEDLGQALDADPESVSRVFAALGSPFRILVLRTLLEGPRTSQQLQEGLGVGAVGQLYHHLKELLAAGLIVQRKRSHYAIREEALIGVCLLLGAVGRLIPSYQPPTPSNIAPAQNRKLDLEQDQRRLGTSRRVPHGSA